MHSFRRRRRDGRKSMGQCNACVRGSLGDPRVCQRVLRESGEPEASIVNEVKPGTILKTSELIVGDVGRLHSNVDHGWRTSIVKQIHDNLVWLWRPYGTTADFTAGQAVICYVGFEEWAVEVNS